MRFTEVKKDIKWKRKYSKLQSEFEEFIKMNIKTAKVDFGKNEYKNLKSAYNVLHRAAKKYRVPFDVRKVGDEIYFVRTDI